MQSEVDQRIASLHAPGIVDMHFDLPMDLYEKRGRAGVLAADYLDQFAQGGIGVMGVAIYLEDRYLPEMALRVALGQVARLREEVAADARFALCATHAEILAARSRGQIALLLTMEGVEPLGSDLDLLRVFYELGVRSVGLTHARRNAAGDGGVFAPAGSSPQGLTAFGKAVVRRCEELGILIDLAHLNPAGVADVLDTTGGPLIISHSNPRAFYDIERNSSDAQIRAVAARGGVIGLNAVLVSPRREDSTIDRFIDQLEYVAGLTSIDAVGLGFDFFEAIFNALPEAEKEALLTGKAPLHFVPGLSHHGHAPNLTRRLIERGWSDSDIAKVLRANWMRVLSAVLRGAG